MDLIKEIKASAEEVLSVLGEGYKENVYEEALAHELRIRDIPFYNNLKHSIFAMCAKLCHLLITIFPVR